MDLPRCTTEWTYLDEPLVLFLDLPEARGQAIEDAPKEEHNHNGSWHALVMM